MIPSQKMEKCLAVEQFTAFTLAEIFIVNNAALQLTKERYPFKWTLVSALNPQEAKPHNFNLWVATAF